MKNGKNIRRAACLGLALAVFATTADVRTVMATAEEEYEDSEQELLTEVVMDETGDSDKEADKEETVYLITDASGNVQETIVSDWLKNTDGSDSITDATNLSDIENVKGDETYTEGENGTITWESDGSDIYYQGTTSQSSPIDINITYYLDGEEISPENLVGKSGKVTIRMDYQNNAKEKVTIGGEEEEIYVPFTVVSGMLLPVDTFSNVEVTNGKLVSDGTRSIVVGVAMPGLKESIDPDGKLEEADTDLEIPEYVEVTADVEDFALDMTLSVAMPDILSDFEFSDTIDMSELEDSMDELNDAAEQLVDGSGTLKDGTDTLEEGAGELQSGASALDSGISQYTAGVSELTGGLGQLKSGSAKLATGASQVSDGVNTLSTALSGLTSALAENIQTQTANQAACQSAVEADQAAVASALTSYATSVAGASAKAAATKAAEVAARAVLEDVAAGQQDQTKIMEDVTLAVQKAMDSGDLSATVSAAAGSVSSEGVQTAISTLATDSGNLGGATGALTALSTINSQADLSQLPTLVQGAQDVASGAATLDAGIQSALNGANTLNGSSGSLKSGSSQLSAGASELAAGVTALSEGAGELNDGMIEFNEEGIQKLTSVLDEDVSTVIDRIGAVFAAGDDYATFTKLAEGQEGRVKFIIRTGSVK